MKGLMISFETCDGLLSISMSRSSKDNYLARFVQAHRFETFGNFAQRLAHQMVTDKSLDDLSFVVFRVLISMKIFEYGLFMLKHFLSIIIIILNISAVGNSFILMITRKKYQFHCLFVLSCIVNLLE